MAEDEAKAAEAGQPPAEGEKKLSKNQLKKLAKGKGKKKEKPQWGEGKKDKKPKKEAPAAPKFVNTTPKGEKKDLSTIPMASAYHPEAVEAAWQDWWEASGFYSCDPKAAVGRPTDEKFVMVIPPPNVTGSLHLGHALTAAVEDTLTRWHRMKGHATLYVPGTDHAGIATQSVVEKMLVKSEGKNRHDLGREEFVKKVWEWKGEYGNKITTQLRLLGSSVDWGRERFTMDDMLSKAVVEAFNQFHEKGLLYRANRLGNWSCALKSAISDIEVDYIDLEGRTFLEVKTHKGNPNDAKGRYEFGTLTSFGYPIEDSEEQLVVATTRLETMLGDTAVAIHPEDPRYKHLHGKFVVHPFNGRRIPIVLDAELVDMEFGTGAVKITPAHDPNDYECGKRHNLEFICILTEDGSINHNGSQFEGMMRYDARMAVEEALKEKGLYKGKEPNKMRLGLCSRSGDVLEPMITPQWYVNCNSMAKRAADAVRNGDLKIVPNDHEKTWFQWLDNIRDWCVSRQLWWGHQIPAWFATKKGETGISKNDMEHNDRWVVARDEEAAYEKAEKLLGCARDEIVLERDEDVLDTWFSSGLFPFSVFGWPDQTDDLKAFYPTSLLETGLDILFFWVARMVMMGLELTDHLPFHTVFLHAMVRDKEGRKMSKSLGNVIDPREVISGCSLDTLQGRLTAGNLPAKEMERAKKNMQDEFPDGIPECGSDALRFGLLAYTVQGRDINLDVKRVVGYRNFCNKLWNVIKFALGIVTDFAPTPTLLDDLMKSGKMSIRDKFMVSRLMTASKDVNECLRTYRFGDAQQLSYSMWMDDLCLLYIELIKPVVYNNDDKDSRWAAQATLWVALDIGMRLLHPMMPFVTEELWQRLPGRGTLGPDETQTIMLAKYPECIDEYLNPEVEASMAATMKVINACRSLRASYRIVDKVKTHFFVKINGPDEAAVAAQTDDIKTLAKASAVDINPAEDAIPQTVGTVVIDEQTTLLMDLKGLVDYEAEIKRLSKSLNSTLPILNKLEKTIAAPGYKENAAENLQKENHEKLEGLQKKKADIEEAIKNFERLKLLETS
ncbi:Valine--tRNA ligase (Fragment) [Seminavis robusta]|uniref:Valine--tRNA ligase, mitochondrial n=1 Tax=Seminavis robusta TaxID=568900 RepID=A0A9N8E099_9STRA